MNYEFPEAAELWEYLLAIEGCEEFYCRRIPDENLVIINYSFTKPDTFPDPSTIADTRQSRLAAMRRDCRGLKFDHTTGKVVTKPYHKFFNIGQKPETQIGQIDWSRPHDKLEKLDGSMLTPYITPLGALVWHTKMGATDVAQPVGRFVEKSPLPYRLLAERSLSDGYSPIFEWCSRQQPIVVDYPVESLILTAFRHTETGRYMAYEEMADVAGAFGIPVVRRIPGQISDAVEFHREVSEMEGSEGFVVRFHDGHAVKDKSNWYMLRHNSAELLCLEKDVWAVVLENRVDDLLGVLPEDGRDAIERFEARMNEEISRQVRRLNAMVQEARHRYGEDTKRFAIEFVGSAAISEYDRSLLFQLWKGAEPFSAVRQYLAKFTGTKNRVDEIRPYVGGLDWYTFYNREFDPEK